MTCWAFQEGDNIFSFSAGEKSRLLQQQLPYLDVVEVARQLPNTVVVKVQPATERFAVDTATGWLVLSDGLKGPAHLGRTAGRADPAGCSR